MGRITSVAAGAALLCSTAAVAQECDRQFDSTYDLIQEVIFEAKGCTSAACHSGENPQGGLDLTAGNSYDQLIDQPAQTVSGIKGLKRLVPINKSNSLLWLNLAAAVLPDEWRAPLRTMPLGGAQPLSFNELELVRMWIEYGSTRNGTVPGAAELVDACSGPPGRLEVEPLEPPAPGDGIQFRAPRQMLAANSEREACFVSYYDIRDQVPAESLSPGGELFRFKRVDARQDPLSHHAVLIVYEGNASIDSPVWGAFSCRGGDKNGVTCDPRDTTFCGDRGVCGSPPIDSVACIGYADGKAAIGTGEKSLFNTMASSAAESEGIYAEAPVSGILVWNSHAFNISDEPAKLDIWVNVEFASAAEQRHRLQRFVNIDQITKMNPPAFGADEVCDHHILPDGAQVLDLSSHTHKRGAKFQMFEGRWACSAGPNRGDPCTPFSSAADFPVRDLCSGFACESRSTPRVGDCDRDRDVTVSELVTGVGIALEQRPLADCPRFDGNGDQAVAISELVGAVQSALAPEMRDPEGSLFYTTLTYADPLVRQFLPARYFATRGSTFEERTITYCALYDNGFTNPGNVKLRSETPENAFGICTATHCAEGKVGERCASGSAAQRDRSCDTAPGANDGACDACNAGFGVTTEDEMFVLTGSYYIP